MKKLKIAILSYRSAKFGGGQGVYIKDISYALSLMGHNVDVISGPPYPDLYDEINLIKLPGLDLFDSFSFKRRLKKFLRKKNKSFDDILEFFSTLLGGFPEPRTFGSRVNKYLTKNSNYDIVIDNQSLSYGMIDIQKRFPFIEIIHHPITKDYKHELEASKKIMYKLSRHRWYSFLKMQKKVAPKINKIITPSKSSKKDIIADFKCNKDNIVVINNGLDADEFCNNAQIKRDSFRLITTASADVPLKGLDYSIKAISELKEIYPQINLVVIGAFKKEGHTERLIKKFKLESNISFKSNLSKKQISNLYSSSSIALVTSLYEGFGYPVIEAMSCSVPLIATNISSIPELTKNYATLIKPKDTNMLVESIKKIISDYDKYYKIAELGRDHIIENFNWFKITNQYENAIKDTIEHYKNANL